MTTNSVLTTSATATTALSHATKTTSSTSSSLSVYDFQASKPETPPIPLQESRKDSKSSSKTIAPPPSDCSKVYSSPENKKTYTELQSKTKKSPAVEEPNKKYNVARKTGSS